MPIVPSQNGKGDLRSKSRFNCYLGRFVDQSPSIVLKVPKAIGVSLNEFTNAIEIFCSSVSETIFKKLNNFFVPSMESRAKASNLRNFWKRHLVSDFNQNLVGKVHSFTAIESVHGLFVLIDFLDDWIQIKPLLKRSSLIWLKIVVFFE